MSCVRLIDMNAQTHTHTCAQLFDQSVRVLLAPIWPDSSLDTEKKRLPSPVTLYCDTVACVYMYLTPCIGSSDKLFNNVFRVGCFTSGDTYSTFNVGACVCDRMFAIYFHTEWINNTLINPLLYMVAHMKFVRSFGILPRFVKLGQRCYDRLYGIISFKFMCRLSGSVV